MHSVQVTNISPDELVERLCRALITNTAAAQKPSIGMINVLNKREAARALGISEKLFDKLYSRACIPCTVNAGTSKSGMPIRRWAEHHLQAIKPEIHKLRYTQDDASYDNERRMIREKLGL